MVDSAIPFFCSWLNMIDALIILIRILFFLSLAFLLLGFVRPVYVLWFMDRCNRLKVLKLYGTLALVFFILHLILD